ncbi:MAG: cobalamin-binding protein [Kangiellaceae bacterium]|nr:cobalamin-binding protein [Kangiellaceae bacterium]
MRTYNYMVFLFLAFGFNWYAAAENSLSNNPAINAQRIIALSPSLVEQLYAIGAGDRIVGTVDYADFPAEAKEILRVGSYRGIQIEKVLALNPDLVVAWKGGNKAADLEKLRSLGVNIYQSKAETISQISEELRELGRLTGLTTNAEKAIAELEQKYRSIKKKYANKLKTKVFYQLWDKPLTTVGPNSWIESLIKDCNGINLFSKASAPYPQVSVESVLVKNPQVIIIAHHSGGEGNDIINWNQWSEVQAVAAKHIYSLNGDLLHRFTPRALDGLEMLCERIDQARN